jgi:putative flippase GtrA
LISRLKLLLWEETVIRWLKFNFVGVVGIIVQLVALKILNGGLGLHYQYATALAVETAVIHNFVWHERFTWVERCGGDKSAVLGRLIRFNLSTGLVSILGNLAIMAILHGRFHWPLVISNIAAIGTCALLNFVVSEHLVFRKLNPDRIQD